MVNAPTPMTLLTTSLLLAVSRALLKAVESLAGLPAGAQGHVEHDGMHGKSASQ